MCLIMDVVSHIMPLVTRVLNADPVMVGLAWINFVMTKKKVPWSLFCILIHSHYALIK